MLRDDGRLLDILKAARLTIEFIGLADKAAFLADAKTQSAVLHQLLILGEAVKGLSPEFRIAHPEVPWNAIRLVVRGEAGVLVNKSWEAVATV